MRHFRTVSALALLLAATLGFGAPAEAQSTAFSFGIFGGIGGSPDSDGYDGSGFQLLAAMELSSQSITGLRFGEMTMDFEVAEGVTAEYDLSYLNVGTEYRLNADYYESGLFIGVGYYQFEGLGVDEDSLGLTLGVTGDFRINPRFSVVIELSGHYADFDATQFFILGHAGLVFRL